MNLKKRLFLIMMMFLISLPTIGQEITHEGEVWGGYISSIRLSEKFALWNDFHYVTNTFFVSRHGLTYFISPKFDVSGGYAYVITNTSFSDNLIRPENRAWGQVVSRFPINDRLRLQVRYRHDYRSRKMVLNQEVIDDRIVYHRIRFMSALRFQIKTLNNGVKWHFDIMDEFLYNVGAQVNNGTDQNRLYLLNGLTGKNYTLLAGYHWRAIPTGNNNYLYRHGLTVWAIHFIEFKGKPKRDKVAYYF